MSKVASTRDQACGSRDDWDDEDNWDDEEEDKTQGLRDSEPEVQDHRDLSPGGGSVGQTLPCPRPPTLLPKTHNTTQTSTQTLIRDAPASKSEEVVYTDYAVSSAYSRSASRPDQRAILGSVTNSTDWRLLQPGSICILMIPNLT